MAMRAAMMGWGAFVLALMAGGACAQDGTPPTPFIVVDQFGYLPDMQKIAVVRDPEFGFDSGWDFTPGAVYQVVDTRTQAVVYEGKVTQWHDGAVDPSSGDHAWRFDFSSLITPGTYVIRDKQAGYDSYPFDIAPNVYKPILVQAVRMLYYQRAGFPKDAQYAGEAWADKASHIGPHQDAEARLYSARNDASTARDLHGGWYDAGDFNRYTRWAGDDVVNLLHAWQDNPGAFTDDFNIPESGNGVPDLLDEVKWEVDWMVRMQNNDGSLLCVLGAGSGSPPSAAHDPSYYGPATTGASYGGAMAFAYAAAIYGQLPQFRGYAADLKTRAIRAWRWAQANPHVIFHNNDAQSPGLAAGDQEADDHGRQVVALDAAIYLFNLTGDDTYRQYVDAHWRESNAGKGFLLDYDYSGNTPLLDYAANPAATPDVAKAIRAAFADEWEGPEGWSAMSDQTDPYGGYMSTYDWGSNATKANHGNIFADEALYGLGKHPAGDDMTAASAYVHYFHGVNPLGKVYLSNMKAWGAENPVGRFYHTWFAPGSKWDSVATSKYGPPPGYVVGGANPKYNWAKGCPGINPRCGTAPPSPPVGEPAQKAYADFNDGWPIDSWEVTEPDLGYQAAYIRLLSRFVS